MWPDRRTFLKVGAGVAALASRAAWSFGEKNTDDLRNEVGITTGSFSQQLRSAPDRYRLPELLSVIRHELDMRVVDVYTPSLVSFDPAYLERVRTAAEKAGCVLTNLKMNQPGLDLGSRDRNVREKAVMEYKRSIDAASQLGMRWARPLPTQDRPDDRTLLAALRELAEYAASRHVQLLIENFGWMQSDPDAVARLVGQIGVNVAASPDTGNWNHNDVRYEGLAKTFPLAVTCDFKARALGADGEHSDYDLERCFQIGWTAGFRGPWCLEHGHPDPGRCFRELRMLRDRLRLWMSNRD